MNPRYSKTRPALWNGRVKMGRGPSPCHLFSPIVGTSTLPPPSKMKCPSVLMHFRKKSLPLINYKNTISTSQSFFLYPMIHDVIPKNKNFDLICLKVKVLLRIFPLYKFILFPHTGELELFVQFLAQCARRKEL